MTLQARSSDDARRGAARIRAADCSRSSTSAGNYVRALSAILVCCGRGARARAVRAIGFVRPRSWLGGLAAGVASVAFKLV